ncbi:MAG: phosphotransferase [Cellulomonas sp.]|nr:phosphotransferase [Cellulomonas sp.]
MTSGDAQVDRLVRRWRVEPTGALVRTPSGVLLPGVRDELPVMLKVPGCAEERRGCALLAWWHGSGGIPVLEHDASGTLMRRATGRRDLTTMAGGGRDDEATAVLVEMARRLHALGRPAEGAVRLLPLRDWFDALLRETPADPLLAQCATVARRLLDAPSGVGEVVALHGDLHHGNVLDLGDRWAAIDPKGLVGEPAFDYANLFCNPDHDTALDRLSARLDLVAALTGFDTGVLAEWVVAWCGLSVVWEALDGT